MVTNLLNRYIWLVDIIYRSGKITLEDINYKWVKHPMSDRNPIPKRTFHNHRIAIEEMFDINIECDKSTYEYYIDNADDMTRGCVRSWLLNTFAINNLINESHKLKHRIQFENIPSGQQYLTPIIEAMRDSVKVDITYQSYWSDAATFEIEPYFIKVFKQRWYVIGKSDKIRIYALDRIQNLNVTGDSYKMPESFDPEIHFQDCYGIIQGGDIKTEKVQLRFDSSQANYIRSLPLHNSQQEVETTDEFAIFEYSIKPTFDFIQEILLHRDMVEVLSPESLRSEIKQIVGRMNEMYIV